MCAQHVHDMKFPVPLFFFSSLGRHEEKAVKLRGLIHLKYCFLLIFQRGKSVSSKFRAKATSLLHALE